MGPDFRRAVSAVAFAAAVGALPACGGSDETPAAAQAPSLDGVRVSGRDEALQIVARGVAAPLYVSELAHARLARAFELRASGTAPAAPSEATIDIEAADHAEGLLLRGEPGFVRAVLRFEHAALGAAAHVDGEIVLEVSRTAAALGSTRSSRADALSVSDGDRTLHWSYLNVEVDAQQDVQTFVVVSDVPVDGLGTVWLDATSSEGRYVAEGVIGFLKARLAVQVAADGSWTIEVDNDKDDRVDYVVQASPDEARALMPGGGR